MILFECKVGDSKTWNGTLLQAGTPYDLTGAVSVTLRYRLDSDPSATPAEVTLTVVAPVQGTVRYAFAPSDFGTAGTYVLEIVVDYGAGVHRTFPDQEPDTIVVYPVIG